MSVVYLLHFDDPLPGGTQHYLGLAANLERRVHAHRTNGTRYTRRFLNRGIDFVVARTWEPGSGQLEREPKRIGGRRLCPLCALDREQLSLLPEHREQLPSSAGGNPDTGTD